MNSAILQGLAEHLKAVSQSVRSQILAPSSTTNEYRKQKPSISIQHQRWNPYSNQNIRTSQSPQRDTSFRHNHRQYQNHQFTEKSMKDRPSSSDYSIHFQNIRNQRKGQSSQISPIPQFQQSSPLNSVLVSSHRPQATILTQREGQMTPHSARSVTPVVHKYYKLPGDARSQSSCSKQPVRQLAPSQILEPHQNKLEQSLPNENTALSYEQKYKKSMCKDMMSQQNTADRLKHSIQNRFNLKQSSSKKMPFSPIQLNTCGIQSQDTTQQQQHQQQIQANQQMKSLQIENAALRQDLQNVMITLQRNQNTMQIRQLQQQQMIKQMNTKNRLLSMIQLIKSLTPFSDTKDEQKSSLKKQQFSQLREALGGHSVNLSSSSLASILSKNQNAQQFYISKPDVMSKSINDIIYDLQKTIENFLSSLESKEKMREELQSKMIHNLKNSNLKEVLKLKTEHAEQVSILVEKVREEEKLIVQDELSQLIAQNQRLTCATISDNQKDTADMFLLRIDNDNLRAQLSNQKREYQDAVNILNKKSQQAKVTLQSDYQHKLLIAQNQLQARFKQEYENKLRDQRLKHQSQIDQLRSKTSKMQEETSHLQKQVSQTQQEKLRYADEKIKQKVKQQEIQQQFTKKMHKQQIQEIKKVHDRINSELQLKLIQVEKESNLKIEQAKIDTRMEQERSRLDLVQQLQSLKRSEMKYLENNNKLAANKLFSEVERMQKLIEQIASNFFNSDALMSKEFFESDVQKIRNGLNNLQAKVHNQYGGGEQEVLRVDIESEDDDDLYGNEQKVQVASNDFGNLQGKRGRSREKINNHKVISVKSGSRERSNSIFKIQAQGKFTNNDSIVSKPPQAPSQAPPQTIMIQHFNNQSLLSYNPLLSTKSNNNNDDMTVPKNNNFSKTFSHQIPPSSIYLSNAKSTQPKLASQNIMHRSDYKRSKLQQQKSCLRCGMLTNQLRDKSFPQIKCKFHPFRLKKGANKFLYTAQWNYCRENCSHDSEQGCLQIHNHFYEDDDDDDQAPEQIRSQTPQKVQTKSICQQNKKLDPLKQSLIITQKQDRRKKDNQDIITLATNDDSISNFSDIRHHSRLFDARQERQPKFKTDARGRSVRSSIESHKGKIKQQLKSVQRRIQQLNQSQVMGQNFTQQQHLSTNTNISNFAKFNLSKEAAADALSPREFIVSPHNGLNSQRSKKTMTFAGDQMSNRLNDNQSQL